MEAARRNEGSSYEPREWIAAAPAIFYVTRIT